MTTGFNIVPIDSLSIDRILEILNKTLGQGNEAYKKSEVLWRWKHMQSPFGPSYGVAAISPDERQLIGIRILMNFVLENENCEKITCSRAVDTVTLPEYQRMGIFTTLTNRAISDLTEQKIGIIFNTPNLRSKAGYLKLGWEIVGSWQVYIKIFRPFSFFRSIIIRGMRNKVQFQPNWNFVFNERVLTFQELTNRYSRQNISDFLESADFTRKKISGWRIKKDFNYIQWRYGSHPNVDYGFVPQVNGDKINGLGILRRNVRFGMVEVIISELLFANSNELLKDQLLKNIKKNISADYLIAHFNNHTPELRLLRKRGFLKAPGQSIDFTVRNLSSTTERFNRLNHWNLSLGDIELL